jgi:hypothetical protein
VAHRRARGAPGFAGQIGNSPGDALSLRLQHALTTNNRGLPGGCSASGRGTVDKLPAAPLVGVEGVAKAVTVSDGPTTQQRLLAVRKPQQ